MEDWEFVESRFDNLHRELEYAKEHPFKVIIDFENRFRIWRDQVIPDRVAQLRKHPHLDVAIRFYDLTLRDVVRLYRRATKEFLLVADDVITKTDKLKFHQELYIERQNLLYNIHDVYVNQMRDIVER